MVEATQLYVVMPLHSCQNSQPTFPLLPEACEMEFHPESSINIENYHFQIDRYNCGILNLGTVVKGNL